MQGSVKALSRDAQLLAIMGTPWMYGGTPDAVRYGVAALVLFSVGAWLWEERALASRLAWPAVAFVGWSLLQAVAISPAPGLTLESASVLAAGLGMVVFWSHEARDEAVARRVAYAVLLVCATQAAFGVVQAAAKPRSLYGITAGDIASPYGSFENHNHFAGLVEMGTLLALAMALGRARRAREIDPLTIGLAGLSLALIGAHLASRSRGGLLALAAGAAMLVPLWWLASSRRAPSARTAAMAGSTLVALFVFGWMAVPSATRAHLTTAFRGPADASGYYRIAIGAATSRLWWSHPLTGSGLGTFEDEVTRFKRSDGLVRSAHGESDALEFLAEGGLVGLVLGSVVGMSVLAGFLERVREGRDPWRKGLAIGALAAVLALLAHSCVDFNLRIPANAFVFCALVGLAAAPRTEPSARLSPGMCRILAAGIVALGAWAGWRALGAREHEWARRTEGPDARLARLTDAVARHPYLANAWRDRANVRAELARGSAELTRYRLERAAADIQSALARRPHWSYAWADLGWLRYRQGDMAGAERAFTVAAELDPAAVPVGLARVEFLARTARYDEARQELRRLRGYNLDWSEEAVRSTARQMGLGDLK